MATRQEELNWAAMQQRAARLSMAKAHRKQALLQPTADYRIACAPHRDELDAWMKAQQEALQQAYDAAMEQRAPEATALYRQAVNHAELDYEMAHAAALEEYELAVAAIHTQRSAPLREQLRLLDERCTAALAQAAAEFPESSYQYMRAVADAHEEHGAAMGPLASQLRRILKIPAGQPIPPA